MNETILVVDDTPTNLQVLVSFLSESGYRMLVAEDGPSALEQLSRTRPDAILLDVAMPDMDGFETCEKIKAVPELQDIPVLFLTARSEIGDKLKGFGAGAVDYITKPIQKEEVIARVKTHLLIVEQRRQLQAMLEQRQRFMRIAAHDLRNLLSVISGYSELGVLSSDFAETQEYLAKIQQGSRQMKAVIDDFLSLRILERAKDGKTEIYDLKALVEQIVDQSSSAAHAKDILLAAQLPSGTLLAQGILSHTHQVLTNYVSNAIKYSPAHTRTAISAKRQGEFWRIEVADQGPGILPSERQQLFVEFAKTSNKPTGGEMSTGLGLSIVKTLAEAQGGRVGAEFPEAGGSVFWLEVPSVPAA